MALAVDSPLAVEAEFREDLDGLALGVSRKELWFDADWFEGDSARFEEVDESLGLLILLSRGLEQRNVQHE